ncbi:MAG: thioredoxin family protein [Fuerstia sp.]|nr:thioredoxin family protein [Fuerstiella sp.]
MRMKFLFSAVLFAASASACQGQTHGWHAAFEQARTAAESGSQPILIHFHAWYCGPCQRMDRELFADPQVQQALTDGMASVKVDVTQEPDLASRCGATSVPRDVVMFPDGTIETLNVGYMQKPQYLNLLRDISARGKSMSVPKPTDPAPANTVVSNGSPEPAATASSDAAGNSAPIVVSEASEPSIDPPLIGLEGFCPVLLHDKREWTAGNEKITTDYRGVRYVFSSEASRDVFLKNPSLYAPQDLGCDAVVLTDTQRAVTGSIRFGAFFDERLYLFQSPENRAQFKQNPLKFVRIRSALRVDQVEGSKFQ